mmetsp:Transcript_36323/g.77463  ORF Transcript_36323/g.77463 Transcript_36323/m.77463 type:complete len:265 (+) Transcript_36323:1703-2497(+)
MPSRSTTTFPSVTTLRRMLAVSSSRRLMSSTYSTPRWALARSPGLKTDLPVLTLSSRSALPMRRSSITLSGTCTNGAGMTSVCLSSSGTPPPSRSVRRKSSMPNSPAGSMLNALPLRTSMGGNSWWMARAMTDLAVPLPPEMTTPPMRPLMAERRRACLIGSCPTTIDSGKGRPPDIIWSACLPTVTSDFAASASSAIIAAFARSSAVSDSTWREDDRCILDDGRKAGGAKATATPTVAAATASAAAVRLRRGIFVSVAPILPL